MDPSSVITQVAPPSPSASASQQPQNVATHINATNSNNDSSGSAAAAAANQLSANNASKSSKKRSRSNFLCSIMCCLGSKKGTSSSRRSKSGKESTGLVGINSAASAGLGPDGEAPDGHLPTTGAGSSSSSSSSSGLAGIGAAVSGGLLGGKSKQLLPEIRPELSSRKCIVIDLDETLVHSSFKPISNADFIVPVEIDGTIHQVYVLKRPHVDEFLCRMGELYECVLFTASLAKYADPVADLLDKWEVFHARLFRESCVFHRGNYVKDLGRLGRELHKIIIVDNSPASYIFHPDNAVPVSSWFDDMNDRELLDLIPFLESLSRADTVYALLNERFKASNSIGNSATTNGN